MNRWLAVALAACLLSGLPFGCVGDSTSSAPSPSPAELTAATDQVVAELKTVVDEATAQAALPKLNALADKIDDFHRRATKGPIETEGTAEAAFINRQRRSMEAYDAEVARIAELQAAHKVLEPFFVRITP